MDKEPRQTSRGFTLVEVLVVLAVLAGLVALLRPALARARERAQALRCQNNLRQLGPALRVYLDDEGHYYPRNLSFLRLDPWEIWVCPSYRPMEPRRRDLYPQDYLENAVGSGSGLPMMPHLGVLKASEAEGPRAGESVGRRLADLRGRPESEIAVPAEMLIIGELERWVSLVSGPFHASAPFRWDMSQGIDFRHQGRASVAFGDNHVEADFPAQLVGPPEGVRRRWNYDHRPHDENWR